MVPYATQEKSCENNNLLCWCLKNRTLLSPRIHLNFDNADAKISQFDLNAMKLQASLQTDDDEIAALTVGGSLLQN